MATVLCVCVDTRRGSINYSVFVGKRDISNWNSLLGMKLGCTSTILRHKRNPWHESSHGLPPSKNLRHQPSLGKWWRQCFETCMVCCCTFLLLMKQSILLPIRPLSKNLTFIEPAHRLWCVHLNFHDMKASTTVRCSHLNEQYTHVEA